ncbi:MAG: hypothetical protein AAGF12_27670 [Myxococcota bacterium]
MGAQGHAAALWEQEGDVWARYFNPDGGWDNVTRVSVAPGGLANKIITLGVASTGRVVAAWSEEGSDNISDVWSTRRTAEGSWSPAEQIEGQQGDARRPDLGIDDDGNAVVVWRQVEPGRGVRVYASRFGTGVGWVPEFPLEPRMGTSDRPKIAVNANGDAVATWGFFQAGRFDPVAATFSLDGWIETTIGAGTTSISERAVALTSGFEGTVLYLTEDEGMETLLSSRFTLTTGWSSGEPLELRDTPVDCPQASVTDSGAGMAVWEQSPPNEGDIWAAEYDPARGWQSPIKIDTEQLEARCPQLEGDGKGNYVAVWWQAGGVWANRFRSGRGWTGAEQIATRADSDNVDVGVDSSGRAKAIWISQNLSTGRDDAMVATFE